MSTEELDMQEEMTAPEAARGTGVPVRTVYYWLDTGELAGSQSITGRRTTTVGAILNLLHARADKDGGEAERRFRAFLGEWYAAKRLRCEKHEAPTGGERMKAGV